jgi:diadenylate cyclase
MSFLDFSILDAIDILLVAFLLYQLYRLIRGTVAINIFLGVAAIYLIWKLVEALQMELLAEILGNFMGVGVIALVIVFQQEIRKFLLLLGSTSFTRRRRFLRQLKWIKTEDESEVGVEEISLACRDLASTRTGALIVIERQSGLGSYSDTGTAINAKLSARLLESIFNKSSPLHDGAVIISGNKIVAAGCILPITEKTSLPRRFGLRHRAAIGIAEKTDALVVIVSEETGDVSLAINDQFDNKIQHSELESAIRRALSR